MSDDIHDVLARVQRFAEQDINIVSTTDAVRMSTEIAKLRSACGAEMIRAEKAEAERDEARNGSGFTRQCMADIKRLRAERDAARAELEQLRTRIRNGHADLKRRSNSGLHYALNIFTFESGYARGMRAAYRGAANVVGPWRDVDASDATAPGTALSGTETDAEASQDSQADRTGVRATAGQAETCRYAQPCPACDHEAEQPT